jgi:hypothetical protein
LRGVTNIVFDHDRAGRLALEHLRDLGHENIAFNDLAAIGPIRVFQAEGIPRTRRRFVVGFDDIQGAAHNNPSLTTVRQPLERMGSMAAPILVERIEGRKDYPAEIAIEPHLVIRESTAPRLRAGGNARGRKQARPSAKPYSDEPGPAQVRFRPPSSGIAALSLGRRRGFAKSAEGFSSLPCWREHSR